MIENSKDSETTSSVIQVLPRNGQIYNDDTINVGLDDNPSSEQKSNRKEDNNQNEEKSISYWNSLYSFVILGVCIISSSTQTLIPWHNLSINPEFWWEDLIRGGLIYMLLRIVLTTVHCIHFQMVPNAKVPMRFSPLEFHAVELELV